MKTKLFMILGLLMGVVLGYPISYWFQPDVLRLKLPLGQYIAHASDILSDKSLQSTAIGAWIGAIVVFWILGAILGAVMDSNQKT